MNLKNKSLLIISSIFTVIFATSVLADIKETLKKMFSEKGIFHYLFIELPSGVFGKQILFALLVFTVLFGVSEFVLKQLGRNVRIALALLIAIIATVALPAEVLEILAKTWGMLFFVLFVLVPIVGLYYILFSTFKDRTRSNYLIKCIMSIVLVYTCFTLPNNIVVEEAETFLEAVLNGVIDLLNIVGIVTIFFALYYLFKFIVPGEVPGGLEETAREVEGLRRAWKPIRRVLRRGYAYEKRIVSDLEKAKRNLTMRGANVAIENIKDAYSKAEKMLGVEQYVEKLIERANIVADANKRKDLKEQINVYGNTIKKDVSSMIELLKEIIDEYGRSSTIDVDIINGLIDWGKEIETAILNLEELERRISD